MPTFALLSDLHLESKSPGVIAALLDACTDGPAPHATIVAGDLCPYAYLIDPERGQHARAFARELARRRGRILYVGGNHELWGADHHAPFDQRPSVLDLADRAGDAYVALGFRWGPLDRGVAHVGRTRVLGCTLWWRYTSSSSRRTRDYEQVRDLEPWIYAEGDRDDAWLHGEVQPGDVVVTHVPPSAVFNDPRFAASALNDFYSRPMDQLIQDRAPAVWCAGHVHNGVDLRMGNRQAETRLLANPVGHAWDVQTTPFNPNLRFEV